jgi:hypothetical protein
VRQLRAGFASLAGFVAAQAIRDVYLRHLFGGLGVFEVALVAFGTITLVLGPGLILFGSRQMRLLRVAWKDAIAVNVTTVVAWMSYFGSLRMLEPAAVNLAFAGVAPAGVAIWRLMGLTSREHSGSSRLEAALHWSLLGIVAALAAVVSSGQSGVSGLRPAIGLAGVALAGFSGIVIAGETILSKRMNEAGISALSILSVRFSLVTAVAAVMVARTPAAFAGLSPGAIIEQSLIFLVILVGPLYLGQVGLKLTNPLLSVLIGAVGPIATLALQSIAGVVPLSPAMLVVTALYAMASVAAAATGVARRLAG